jgi:hypothetical protein
VELDAEDRQTLVADALVRAVVGVAEPGGPAARQGRGVDGEAVVLAGDVAALGALLEAGLVLAAATVAAARSGSPGPLEMTTPRGAKSRMRAAPVSAGTRTTETPRRVSERMIPILTPQSMRTTVFGALGL